MAGDFSIGDRVLVLAGSWEGAIGEVVEVITHLFLKPEIKVSFNMTIKNMEPSAMNWSHIFEEKELFKLDEAGELIYGEQSFDLHSEYERYAESRFHKTLLC